MTQKTAAENSATPKQVFIMIGSGESHPYGNEPVFIYGETDESIDQSIQIGEEVILNITTVSAYNYDEALGTDGWYPLGTQRPKEIHDDGTYIYDFLGVRYTLVLTKNYSTGVLSAKISAKHIGTGFSAHYVTAQKNNDGTYIYDASRLKKAMKEILTGERSVYIIKQTDGNSNSKVAEVYPASAKGTYTINGDNITVNGDSYVESKELGWRLPISDSTWATPVFCGSMMTPLYEEAGATFNTATGFYELNGITDIDEDEMRKIYYRTAHRIGHDAKCAFADAGVRTNLPLIGIEIHAGGFYAQGMFAEQSNPQCQTLEVVTICNTNKVGIYASMMALTDAMHMFWHCSKLRKVIGTFAMHNCNQTFAMFLGCSSLEEVSLLALHTDLSFADSPKISAASLAYAIENASAGGFTITVNAATFAKMTGTASADAAYRNVYAAAQAKGISIVSA